MNNANLNVCKKVLQEVCEKFDGTKELIKDKIEDTCSNEIISGSGNLFVYERLRQILKIKLVVFVC